MSELSFEQIALDRLKIGVSRHIPRYILDNGELGFWVEGMSDTVVSHFRSEVLAHTFSTETAEKQVRFQVPASWWQAFKATYALTWWLSWLVDRRPVRYRTEAKTAHFRVATQAIFPDATVRYPKELGNPVVIRRVQAEGWSAWT
jgi:hypothetical protein